MNLAPLLPAIRELPHYRAALAALPGTGRRPLALGLMRAARAPVLAALAGDRGAEGPLVLLTARHDRALALAEELAAWDPAAWLLPFSEPTPVFYERSAWGPRTVRNRLAVLAALAAYAAPGYARPPQARPPLVLASARALMSPTLPLRDFLANTRALRSGQGVRLEKLLQTWVGAGYEPGTVVVEPGQFSRRGGILDIWPPADPSPTRIELFGDELDSLRQFDPATQRSGARVESVLVTPAREALPRLLEPGATAPEKQHAWRALMDEEAGPAGEAPASAALEFLIPLLYPSPASLLDYLPPGALVALDDWQEIEDAVNELEEQAVQLRADQVRAGLLPEDFPLAYHTLDGLRDSLAGRPRLYLSGPPEAEEDGQLPGLGARFRPGPRYGGQLKPLMDQLRHLSAGPDRAVVVTRQARRLAELWGEDGHYLPPVEVPPADAPAGSLVFVQGAMGEGWTLVTPDGPRLHLLTDGEIFGWARPEPRRRAAHDSGRAASAPESRYADFAAGDYVVHVDFGIGRYTGLVRRTIDALEREYLQVQFGGDDQLYVPIHQAERLTRYVGADETPPTLSRLGTQEWERVKERARAAVEEVAREMLDLYAARELARGHAFSTDTPWQRELEAAFPYQETEDQLRAIHEVKRDMESNRPMDRLICGDVGYGKTEVALRAAFKAIMDGAQVALLVPTTILAQQHLQTFQQRLAPFPTTVEMLSRFRTPAQQDEILRRLLLGEVDIVIGTHRLLGDDVQFKNLGLLIIDEEQRFGVTHKEMLKRKRTEVDVLTMTATPIPRTLYMSLTGVRDISPINTPPDERLPVITHVGPYSERTVRQAILRELERGGQVFYLHNRVQTIESVRQRLERLAPAARIAVAHGQMNEKELARVMDQFTGGQIDLLLCTTIIESGLDIPNANTLIVERADAFGLAELYQLRGRVGRGAARAYAYFFRDGKIRPTPDGFRRLETIAEHTELGAGYSIAMRDLEMRGAGDLLGMRQHGHIAAVGFHLYTRLLARAVRSQTRGFAPTTTDAKRTQPAAAPGLLREAEPLAELHAVTVDLPIPTVIPAGYVADRNLRLRLYRRLADIRDEGALAAVATEFEDRFGPLPAAVENLLFQLRIKLLAQRAGVDSVSVENGQPVIRWAEDVAISASPEVLQLRAAPGPGARLSKNQLWLPRTGDDQGWRASLENILRKLAG